MAERVAAGFNIAGALLGAIGSLYLAFDLLGGRAGPLSLITRVVTYGILFGLGYGLGLGIKFGLIAGVGLGIVLCFEFWSLSADPIVHKRHPWSRSIILGVTRSLVLAVALMLVVGSAVGMLFLLFMAPLLSGLNVAGFTPTHALRIMPRPRFSSDEFIASILRGAAGGLSIFMAWLLSRNHQIIGGAYILRFMLTVGLTSFGLSVFVPVIEWWAQNAPQRWVAAAGAMMVVVGFFLQSVPYWVTLLR
jgi:hypothetical protein